MLKPNERKELEKQVLQYSLNGINDFIELKSNGIEADSFREPINKRIFQSVELYIKEKRNTPEIDQLYSFMIATGNNSMDGLVKYISYLFPYSFQDIPVKRLIEDNIEIETKEILKRNENQFGLDYAVNLNEQIGNVILKHTGNLKKEKSTSESLRELIKEIESGKPSDEYIPTGIKALDKHIIGIPKKHITVIGARPGQGKTTFALQLKRNFVKQGLKVGMFSLEMDSKDLLIKDIASVTEIDSLDIENNRLKSNDYDKIRKAEDMLNTENFVISEKAYQTPQQIKATINQWKIQKGIDVIIIDYLQLIKTNYKKERFDLEIGMLSNDLRIFAKETGTPIIILSQLNRQVESRSYSRPIISDLRESGQIEQDAKLILLLYYPDKYGVNVRDMSYKKQFDFDIEGYRDANGKEIPNNYYFNLIIGKARSGRTGNVHLKYLPQFHKFEDITRVTENYYPETNLKPSNEFFEI
ncbi:MAG: hypothetical protein K8F36_14745 [Melioribacteraceae bacterium]|nr:hypothetical protein [Melioribacteraceae bacterium]